MNLLVFGFSGGTATNTASSAPWLASRRTMPCLSWNFLAVDRAELMLMPPSMAEWLPEEHLVGVVAIDGTKLISCAAGHIHEQRAAARHRLWFP